MSFEAFVFARTIPPTVPSSTLEVSAAAAAAAATTSASTSVGTPSNTSNAVSLVTQLGNLIDTANYLQTLILSLNAGLGTSVNAASNPELAMALATIYNGQAPPAISLQMYSYQLDAEIGASLVNQATGGSSVQANPFQTQALLTANKAFESDMALSGVFAAQSSLLLRGLKTSVITNTTIQQSLLTYPAANATQSTSTAAPSANVIPAATIDVSPAVAGLVQAHIDGSGQVMSSMYQVLAQPDPIAEDVASVVSALTTVAVPDLIRMNGLLQMTQAGSLSNSVQGLSVGLSAFTFPQMLGQASGVMSQLDQVSQMAIVPAIQMKNSVGSATQAIQGASTSPGLLVGVVRSMKVEPSTQSNGPLAGMPLNSGALSGLAMSSPMPASLAKVGLTPGLNEVSSLMSFSIGSAQSAAGIQQDAFQRLSARVLADSGGLTQVLAAVSSITSLTSLVSAFIREQQNGPAVASQSSGTQLQTVSRILASSQTGNGTAYTVQGGTVTLTPPNAPVPTPGAASVFAESGIQTSLQGLTQNLVT